MRLYHSATSPFVRKVMILLHEAGAVNRVTLVPAAGSGRRFGGETPKQYLQAAGKTLIEHALDALLSHPQIKGGVVALAPNDVLWPGWTELHGKPVWTCVGGREVVVAVIDTGVDYRHRDLAAQSRGALAADTAAARPADCRTAAAARHRRGVRQVRRDFGLCRLLAAA